jgi:hypothetical protein
VWAVLVGFLKLQHVLPEGFLALFASKNHVSGFLELVVFELIVTLGAVEPLFAALGSDSGLDIDDVFAHCM